MQHACDKPIKRPIELDRIRNPEEGLALLANVPDFETIESAERRRLWRFLFAEWRDALAGDTLAFARALLVCSHSHLDPPPALLNALFEHLISTMTDEERQDQAALLRHRKRWAAMQESRARGFSWPKGREAASERLASTDAAGQPSAVKASYELVEEAGGRRMTLISYRRVTRQRTKKRRTRRNRNPG